jgi:hypothetical protein
MTVIVIVYRQPFRPGSEPASGQARIGLTSQLPYRDDRRRDVGSNSSRIAIVNDVLTIEEIKTQYPSEWVLIEEPQLDEMSRLLAGRVLFHSAIRDEVYRKAVELHLPHFAVRYLGSLPENMALVL